MSEAHRDRLAASFETIPGHKLADRLEVFERVITADTAGGLLTSDEARQLNDYLESLVRVTNPTTYAPPYLHLRRLIAFRPPLGDDGKWTQAQVKAALEGGRLSEQEAEALRKAVAERMGAQLLGVFGPPEVEVPPILPPLRRGEVDVPLSEREWATLGLLESVTMFQHGTTQRPGSAPGERYVTVDFTSGFGEPDTSGYRRRDSFEIELSSKEMTG